MPCLSKDGMQCVQEREEMGFSHEMSMMQLSIPNDDVLHVDAKDVFNASCAKTRVLCIVLREFEM